MEEISSSFLKHVTVSADELKAYSTNLEALKAKGVTEDVPEPPKHY
jgi:hypothetical protein